MMQQTAAAAVVLLMAMAMPMAQTNLLVSAQTQTIRNFIQKPQLSKLVPKSKENDWVSFDKNTEFLPADATSTASSNMARMLASSSTTYNPYAAQAFVDGVNTEYDSYQQAWRYLGFMIDCDASTDDDNNSGSGDQGTDDGCERYVLWAAYVDLGYEGGGISEYQYWDRWTNEWDATSCNYNQNSGDNSGDDNDDGPRCAKMDCHLEDTHFSLLGFFKHKDIDDWFGQLFKHEGMCIWTESEYSFMKNAKGAWPAGCSISTTYIDDDESQPIYYDIKPTSGGGMTLGLYTDTRCIVEYVNQGSDDPITVENVLGNIIVEGGSGSGDNDGDDASAQYETLEEALAAWDSAFDIFKICQPCVAHDLENVGYNTDDDASKGSNYGNYNTDDDNNNGGYSDFDCYDDADYTNVNQVCDLLTQCVGMCVCVCLCCAQVHHTVHSHFIATTNN